MCQIKCYSNADFFESNMLNRKNYMAHKARIKNKTLYWSTVMLKCNTKDSIHLPGWSVWSLLSVWPRIFIDITPDIFPLHYNDVFCSGVITSSIHYSKQRHLVLRLIIIYIPPRCKKEILQLGSGMENLVEWTPSAPFGGQHPMTSVGWKLMFSDRITKFSKSWCLSETLSFSGTKIFVEGIHENRRFWVLSRPILDICVFMPFFDIYICIMLWYDLDDYACGDFENERIQTCFGEYDHFTSVLINKSCIW